MRKLFLYKLYCYNKKLFLFFTGFAVLTLLCNLAGFEITPFYVWGMYSQKEVTPKDYPVFVITVNDKPVDYSTGYLPANRFFLLSPLSYYANAKSAGDPTAIFLGEKLKDKFSLVQPFARRVFNSKKELSEFPAWFRRYLQQTTGNHVKALKVDVIRVKYDHENSITINSVDKLIDEN